VRNSLSRICVLLLACLATGGVNGAEPGRGRLLYENNCIVCHKSTVHIRRDRKAESLVEIRAQVTRWAEVARPEWGDEEISAVVNYLNATYYNLSENNNR
jgi:mono/diheme cytochrome c family protein